MNKKDIKKSNISANSINDDSLENVSGGYCGSGNTVFAETSAEREALEKAGFSPCGPHGIFWKDNRTGKPASGEDLLKVLKNNNFENNMTYVENVPY